MRDDAIRNLQRLMNETLPYFSAPREQLDRAYAPGKWTLREVLVHLSDSETVILDRLRRAAAEPAPHFDAFDQDRWAELLQYKTRDLSVARAQFEAARRSIIELASTMPLEVDARTGVHSETGTRSFAQLLAAVQTHNAHHLAQAKACAEGRTWTK